ncbi:Ankyrin repeat-containing protein ITN1 [Bienertia sinuspersici]
MRSTLSVVAALLATITFAAGFTLPGGLNQETGDAILAKKAIFLVFLLSDVYAMCTSMLVLFCLIWSMVSKGEIQYILVDRSVLILMQSLYGTMVAFTTAIFSVTSRRSLWAGITIFVMCSFIGIAVNRTILHKVLARLPKANKDPIHLLEKVKSFTCLWACLRLLKTPELN